MAGVLWQIIAALRDTSSGGGGLQSRRERMQTRLVDNNLAFLPRVGGGARVATVRTRACFVSACRACARDLPDGEHDLSYVRALIVCLRTLLQVTVHVRTCHQASATRKTRRKLWMQTPRRRRTAAPCATPRAPLPVHWEASLSCSHVRCGLAWCHVRVLVHWVSVVRVAVNEQGSARTVS